MAIPQNVQVGAMFKSAAWVKWGVGFWGMRLAIAAIISCIGLLSSSAVHSQSAEMLPPPPPIPAGLPPATPDAALSNSTAATSNSTALPPVPLQPLQPQSAPLQETVFQAPIANPSLNNSPPNNPVTNTRQYLVYVNGDSPLLLQQVKTIEPSAFIQQYQGQRVIQVGRFSEEANAQRQMAALAAQGIRSEMVGSGSAAKDDRRRYVVVVPGDRGNLPQLASAAVQLGVRQEAILSKNAPLGPHLQIGPFARLGEAEAVNRSLRKGGLDARVYYSRE